MLKYALSACESVSLCVYEYACYLPRAYLSIYPRNSTVNDPPLLEVIRLSRS